MPAQVGETLHREPSSELQETLYYLQALGCNTHLHSTRLNLSRSSLICKRFVNSAVELGTVQSSRS